MDNLLAKQIDLFGHGILIFQPNDLTSTEKQKTYHDLLIELKNPTYAKILEKEKDSDIAQTFMLYCYEVGFANLTWRIIELELCHLSKSFKLSDISFHSYRNKQGELTFGYIKVKYEPKTSTTYRMIDFKIVVVGHQFTDREKIQPHLDDGYQIYDIFNIEGFQRFNILYKTIV
jgi:hypothetical protein